MTTKHTPGKLEVYHKSYFDTRICPEDESNTQTVAVMGNWADSCRGEQMANADHLVDCWNALDGLNPEAIPELIEVVKDHIWLEPARHPKLVAALAKLGAK